MRKIATLVLVVLLSAGTTACSRDEDGLPEYASLNDAYGAVDAVVNCDTNPPAPTEKVLHPPGPTGESRMCTDLSLIHISEPTRPCGTSRMPSSA